MTTKTTRDRFLDALDDTYDALLGAVEATEKRGHKVSKAVLTEARKGEKELVTLARKWADSPTAVYDNLGAMIDAQARAELRLLELARDALGGADEYRSEVQDALTQAIKANRRATDATLHVARDTTSKALERVRGATSGRARPRPTKVPVASGNGSKE